MNGNTTLPLVVASAEGEMKNAPESAALRASVACATHSSTTEYSTEPCACQSANAPTLEEIEHEIAAAARQRIEAARRDLNDTARGSNANGTRATPRCKRYRNARSRSHGMGRMHNLRKHDQLPIIWQAKDSSLWLGMDALRSGRKSRGTDMAAPGHWIA